MKPELIADYRCDCGEGPLWHPMEGRLYWVDIPKGRLFRYDPATGHHEQCHQGDVIGGFTIQADGALLLFMARGAVKTWRDGRLTSIIEDIPEERDSRFNDVIADPQGRVFCGTMPTANRKGRLWRLDRDGTVTMVLDNVGGANGLGFTPDRRKMYFTDSRAREICIFDYDRQSGEISNGRLFVRVAESLGIPDGMTVDAEGHVWSALWDGSSLVRFRPDGTLERRIKIPAPKVSSMTFGGPDYTDIYATTAGGGNKAQDGPGAGALFRLRLGIRGVPEFLSRVGL